MREVVECIRVAEGRSGKYCAILRLWGGAPVFVPLPAQALVG